MLTIRPQLGRRKAVLVLVLGVAAPLLAFLALGIEVRGRRSLVWDAALVRLVNGQPVRIPDELLHAERVAALALVGLLLVLVTNRRRRQAVLLTTAVGGALLLDEFVKSAFPRPPLSGPGLSFPSGYATVSMATAVAVVLLAWQTRWRRSAVGIAAIVVLGTGLAVVDAGWHYPSDVLGGWCVGICWVSGAWLLTSAFPAQARRPIR